MSKSSVILVVLAAFTAGSFAVTSEVFPPITETGDELALIFVPGAEIKGEQYRDTAVAIQRASRMRIWVALTGNYTLGTPNPIEVASGVQSSIAALRAKGMLSRNYVGLGHSLGGIMLSQYARQSPLKAIVLLGSYLGRNNTLRDYPLPVLTLSGELDGQTRITRIALEYEKLLEEAKQNKTALYRTPVINIKGSCHAQFASGPMPSVVKKYDLKPAIAEQVAHGLMGRYIASFVTVLFNSVQAKVEEARKDLDEDFKESGTRFLPLLGVKALDEKDGEVSPWAQICQAKIAGELASRVTINNEIFKDTPSFLRSKPSITKLGSGLELNTTTFVEYDHNPFDISTNKESPREIDVKMKSRDAIKEALNLTEPGFMQAIRVLKPDENQNIRCKYLNEMAFKLALANSTTQAQERYRSYGRPITFMADLVFGTGLQWSGQGLGLVESDAGLAVQGVALITPTSSPFFPGMHYCKVLSPYRAMEWINVDSLRAHKPS